MVSFGIRSSQRKVLHSEANFGFGTPAEGALITEFFARNEARNAV
jgi:hypothetical protein